MLEESFDAKVMDLIYFDNFEQIFDTFPIEILADKTVNKNDLLKVLNTFYPPDKQKQYGVCCIKVELLN